MLIKSIKNIQSTPIEAGSGASMQMLISPEDAPNFAMRKFTIKAGGFMPYHTNTVEHEQYVIKGTAKVNIAGKESIVKKDDVIFIPAGVAHSYHIEGNEDYEFLCLVPNKTDKIEMA
ncbi:cupin domain-containing protein [Sulfurospirillum arcachonense]|uniref:cupin domain-containing protein n=1 Tax=Sulfurospirillum arcachonense TaxID=57666 RepID=UPI00046A79DA|nr:cupin domain-containing protein [Sulfurospirillum arcachonense]